MSPNDRKQRVTWAGVFPAVTVQYRDDRSYGIDLEATARVVKRLIADGVSGLVVNGTVGENCSLSRVEKLDVLEAAVAAAAGRVPVLCGIAEYTSAFAIDVGREVRRLGADGIMLMPAMVYSATPFETVHHFRSVATALDLPVMVYNNPPIYRTDVTPEMLAALADVETIVAFKESSGDTRRFTDLVAAVGGRFVLFAGLDDVVLESVLVGAVGWVSGLCNAFPHEAEAMFWLARAGRYDEALAIYRWFLPLLHLDARADLVQCIKLCERLVGRGGELTRPPRLPLDSATRAMVERLMATALATRPALPKISRPAA